MSKRITENLSEDLKDIICSLKNAILEHDLNNVPNIKSQSRAAPLGPTQQGPLPR